MQSETLLFIILAGIGALLLALFQYKTKTKSAYKLHALLMFLRFLTYFSILLLLINPKFETKSFYSVKPSLVVAVDNSSSISYLNQNKKVETLVKSLKDNTELNEAFNIDWYTFGNSLSQSDTLDFKSPHTQIHSVFRSLTKVYKKEVAPAILISDGNQTMGSDYEFVANKYKQPIYPVILGDTIVYSDLKISNLNVNKYVYLKNEFPVEAILVYNGKTSVNTKFVVTAGNSTVYSKAVSFDALNTSKVLNFTLPANSVGVHTYRAQLIPISNEKNKINNSKSFAVEVIDQTTKVAVISQIMHPDLGVLKKAIESNEQREVVFLKPNEAISKINDFQLAIVYQPDASFKPLYDVLNSQNINKFVIAGTQTDWNFLNTESKLYSQDRSSQTEDYQPVFNTNFSNFIVEDLEFESFPPLHATFNETVFSVPFETLLFKSVSGINTQEPLLVTLETNGRREALLLGENLWKWRAQSFLNTQNFNAFDAFMSKLVQYLASNTRKSRLNVEYETFYQDNTAKILKAQFFNKNYEFDAKAQLLATIKDKKTGSTKQVPFILKDNVYEVDLNNLPASDYSFTVSNSDKSISKSGQFKIIDFNVEQQFLNADVTKLQNIAVNSDGASFFIDDYSQLIPNLLKDKRFTPIQKSNKNVVPLIDWKYLLFLIAISLSIEWFLRKYNGLI